MVGCSCHREGRSSTWLQSCCLGKERRLPLTSTVLASCFARSLLGRPRTGRQAQPEIPGPNPPGIFVDVKTREITTRCLYCLARQLNTSDPASNNGAARLCMSVRGGPSMIEQLYHCITARIANVCWPSTKEEALFNKNIL
jgi:hypothetical protein